MPTLHWASKPISLPVSSVLETDSIVYPRGTGYPDACPQNALILGDNLAVMSALLPEYENLIDLIYADPPFFTNRHYPARVGRGEDSRKPQEWQLAEGYPDHWRDIDAYLDMLYPRLALMHRLLAPTGALYLHLDWHASAYARLLLDGIFGSERLLNEIVWVYHGPSPIRRAFNRKHDTILAYTKTEGYIFNTDAVRQPYDPNTVKTFASSPKAGFGKVPDLARGKVPEDWWYFPVVARLHNERTGYPTQKPQALLERIILASSNPGALTADFFCGSGTMAVAASRLGRRYIASDVTWRAVHTTRSRLVETTREPFTLRVVSGSRLKVEKLKDENLVTCNLHPATGLKPSSALLSLSPSISALDYWEADPAWDGKIFCSAAQAVRSRKSDTPADHLNLPVMPGEKPVCVRFVWVNGDIEQVVFAFNSY